jgi:zinc transport system substrate-binding protein
MIRSLGSIIAVVGIVVGVHGGVARADRPRAVATIFSYYDALRAIGGGDAQVDLLLPAGQSPHEYTPSVRDKVTVAQAQLIVVNGLAIDNWGIKLAEGTGATVLNISDIVQKQGIQPLHTTEVSITPEGEKGAGAAEDVSLGNPHIWLDPRVQAMAAEAIGAALEKIDPEHKDGYASRTKAYVGDLTTLDHDFAAAVKDFKTKEFIGFHSAYEYLANRYGLKQIASVEEVPDQGPSLAQTANIINLINQKGIKVVFVENAFPAKPAEQIARETGATLSTLQPIETYDNKDQTYVGLMRENLASLKKALE